MEGYIGTTDERTERATGLGESKKSCKAGGKKRGKQNSPCIKEAMMGWVKPTFPAKGQEEKATTRKGRGGGVGTVLGFNRGTV